MIVLRNRNVGTYTLKKNNIRYLYADRVRVKYSVVIT